VVWLSLVAAIISYFAIEEPLRHAGRLPWKGFALGVGPVSVGACVAVTAVVLAPPVVGSGAAVQLAEGNDATPQVIRDMNAAVASAVAVQAARATSRPAGRRARDYRSPTAPAATPTSRPSGKGPCVYGDRNGTHTMVLLGDSHADMWLGAFSGPAAGRVAGRRLD